MSTLSLEALGLSPDALADRVVDRAAEQQRAEELDELIAQARAGREQAERDRVNMQIAAEAEAEARMSKATGTLAQALRKLASGDLLCEVTEAFAPQFEDLRHDFNRSVVQLRQALDTAVAGAALDGRVWQGWIDWLYASGRLDEWMGFETSEEAR